MSKANLNKIYKKLKINIGAILIFLIHQLMKIIK